MIALTYHGTDGWDRPVFIDNNGKFYKTTEPEPHIGFESLPMEKKYVLLQSLHTTDSLDGEPDSPCWKEGRFYLGCTKRQQGG
jgi:hypothetical protein